MKTICRLGTAVECRLVFCLYLANLVATLLHQTSPVSVLVFVFVFESDHPTFYAVGPMKEIMFRVSR